MGRSQPSADVTTTPAQTRREDLSVLEMTPNLLLKPVGREGSISNPVQPRLAAFFSIVWFPLYPENGTGKVGRSSVLEWWYTCLRAIEEVRCLKNADVNCYLKPRSAGLTSIRHDEKFRSVLAPLLIAVMKYLREATSGSKGCILTHGFQR